MFRRRLLILMILKFERLADQVVEIGYLSQGDLTAREERVHAEEIDHETALDPPSYYALHDPLAS